MRKNIVIICLIWTAITSGSFFLNYKNALNEERLLSLQTARSFFQQIVLFRSWNAIHGGVYVPVTTDTQPNPYMQIPLRDIKVNRNLTLTKINPAFMTRQVSELAMKKDGVKFRITSLLPIRPENKPTPIEETALKEFETGVMEKGEIINENSRQIFFYMASLKTEKSCLPCHAKQGYREGDVRGGISVTFPYTSQSHISATASVHLFMLFAGLFGLIYSGLKLSKAYDVIKRQAVFDALTGIPNRHSFSERIFTEYKRSLRDNYPLSVIMGDIDNFKLYNDTYGHAGGDECLKSVAKIIEATLKRPGDFCARYGGEEFIIILPATDNEGAGLVAENIRKNVFSLNIPHEKSTHEKFVTISLGIATKNNDSTMTSEELLKMADDALYIAKEKGRNRVEVFNG
ncbi:MAG: diguanylate cyclase [Spirochaetae bacterium HGW-Spirochaetae-5]|nr:MAG: diguanylate cyclase [Spirochaetae bacterium HGW-Spirochaetae-5]